MPEQSLPTNFPLALVGKVADRIGFEYQEAQQEKRPLSTFGIAKALWEGGFLAEPTVAPAATEPLLHTGIDDCLPESHPLAFTTVDCTVCGAMVHAGNNECMRPWVETGKGAFCLPHFTDEFEAVDDEDAYALRGDRD